jgi:hypothetical protein
MVAHTCNSTLGRLKQKDHKFEDSLHYRVRPCLKKKKGQGQKGFYLTKCCNSREISMVSNLPLLLPLAGFPKMGYKKAQFSDMLIDIKIESEMKCVLEMLGQILKFVFNPGLRGIPYIESTR